MILFDTTYIRCDNISYWAAKKSTECLSALKIEMDWPEVYSSCKVNQHPSRSWLYNFHATDHESKESGKAGHARRGGKQYSLKKGGTYNDPHHW